MHRGKQNASLRMAERLWMEGVGIVYVWSANRSSEEELLNNIPKDNLQFTSPK